MLIAPPAGLASTGDVVLAQLDFISTAAAATAEAAGGGTVDPFVFRLSIFVLAVFVGYYVVWSVTPALHTRWWRTTLARSGPARLVLSRSSSPRSTSSAAFLSPSACWGCIRRRRDDSATPANLSPSP